jgi:DAK2 domain fusion protein YloV
VDRESVQKLARAALQNLEANRSRIDDLNVYPVPDGDTGTNLVLTMRGVVEALERVGSDDRAALGKEVTRAALLSARGNSGVIFSQIVRGFVDGSAAADADSSRRLAGAFRSASDAAYRAVKEPVEGTMLTIIREMAEEAEARAGDAAPPLDLLSAVVTRGEDALARTPEMLDVLRVAGVVDAGGAGLVEIVRGGSLSAAGKALPDAPAERDKLGLEAIHQELSRYRYCTTYVVEGDELDLETLEGRLERLGDSLLVVGDASALKVHVHTDDPGAALSLGTAVGVIGGVEIANMRLQATAREERLLSAPLLTDLSTGLVAVAQGAGNKRLFEGLGASIVIEGGQTLNPSAAEIVAAVEAVPAPEVIVLPNNSNVILAAEQAAALTSARVRIVPSGSVQAGLAAASRFVPTNGADENEEAMREALASVSTGEVTIASRDAQLDGIRIREGAFLGLVGDEAVASADSFDDVARAVLARILEREHDHLDLISGADAPPLEGLLAELASEHPELEVEVHEGGQPHYPLLLVAE